MMPLSQLGAEPTVDLTSSTTVDNGPSTTLPVVVPEPTAQPEKGLASESSSNSALLRLAINLAQKQDAESQTAAIELMRLLGNQQAQNQSTNKTPFSPEHLGPPVSVAPKSLRFPTKKKRGPSKSQTLDGLSRKYPPQKDFNNIVRVLGRKNYKSNQKVKVEWSNFSKPTWEVEQLVVAIPRLKALVEKYVIDHEFQKAAKRREAYNLKCAAKNQKKPLLLDEPLSPPLSNAKVALSATTIALSAVAPLDATIEPFTANAVPVTATAVPSTVTATLSTPILEPVDVPTAAKPETPTRKCRTRKGLKRKASPSSSEKSRKDPTPLSARKKCRTNPTTNVGVADDTLGTYRLAPSMATTMERNRNIQLVEVEQLFKYVEYDRTITAKIGSTPMKAVKQMQENILQRGITEEILLVYSTEDDKMYAVEGNTKIAAVKNKRIVDYLPARVVISKERTPKRKGAYPPVCPLFGSNKLHIPNHSCPSKFGFKVADYVYKN